MSDSLVEPSPPTAPLSPRHAEGARLGGDRAGASLRLVPEFGTGGSASPEGAAQGRFYMTSDLRAATGLTRTHLDFYLREGLVRPTARAESGYLLFDEAELATLRTVLRWRQDGIGLRQIRQRLGR